MRKKNEKLCLKDLDSEISYISVENEQTPSWDFEKLDRLEWAEENEGKAATIGIVLGYQVFFLLSCSFSVLTL